MGMLTFTLMRAREARRKAEQEQKKETERTGDAAKPGTEKEKPELKAAKPEASQKGGKKNLRDE